MIAITKSGAATCGCAVFGILARSIVIGLRVTS